MPFQQAHFGFTKLVVGDLEKMARFYTEVCGLKEQHRVQAEIAGRPISEILFDATAAGAATFVLLRFDDDPTPVPGEVILGFITTDVDALVDRATADGGSVVEAVREQREHGVKVGFVADPEGRLIEVVELLAA